MADVEGDDVGDAESEAGEGGVRPFWSGVLTFGLVSVPVELYTAVGRSRVALHLLSPEGHPLRRRYVSAESRAPLERDELVRGFATDSGTFVTVTDDELAALEPERSREIDLRRFVDRGEIDALYGERGYFLLPAGEVSKAYRLLAAIMEKSGKAGVATFVMRGREQAIAIYAEKGILRAEALRRRDELRTPEAVGLPEPLAPDEELIKQLRVHIRKHLKAGLDTKALGDETAAAVRQLADTKRKKGRDVVEVPEELTEGAATTDTLAPIIDIVTVLKERLGAARKAAPAATAPAAKAPAAKAPAAKSKAPRSRRAARG